MKPHLHSELLRTRLSFKKKMEKVRRRRNQREIFLSVSVVCVYLERLGGYKSGPPA